MVFPACHGLQKHYVGGQFGLWRSLVARPSGGRKVAGSSPASPTIIKTVHTEMVLGGLVYLKRFDFTLKHKATYYAVEH